MILSEAFFNVPWDIWLAGHPDTKILDADMFKSSDGQGETNPYYQSSAP